ncbi:hypothetical protein ABDK96_01600 [Citricoccus nitrophenolicus]|uniref:DoxX family protein n=1 Tax=Citricoccus nitrophenolicus TaxID=863575 RepID=A0ABV0IDZ8_9MICC
MTRPMVMATVLAGMGVLHLAAPRPFDGLIPRALPGPARAWTYGSGVAELAVAGLLAVPGSRRAGGRAAQLLFLAVWPGNFYHAYRARNASPRTRAITLARLPLQLPMIAAAGRIAAGR